MLVVDASVLFEVVAGTPRSEALRRELAVDVDHAAPHLIDAEVFGVIRKHHALGRLDRTAARTGGPVVPSGPDAGDPGADAVRNDADFFAGVAAVRDALHGGAPARGAELR